MPEIFHSNELDGIIGIKKRLTKNLKKTFASEEPFGLTVGDAKGLDSLVSATEEIETNAQLVLSKLNKTGDFQSAEKQINNFYKAVRKGLNIVKNLKSLLVGLFFHLILLLLVHQYYYTLSGGV